MWTGIGAAGLAGLSQLLGGGLSSLGAASANSNASHVARQNRKWMERMSNTAHQREVADLRAAGLNPILSATGGSGASVPSSSAPPVQNELSGLAEGIGASIESFLNLKKSLAEIDLIKANSAKAVAEASSVTRLSDAQWHDINSANLLKQAQTSAVRFDTNLKQIMKDYDLNLKVYGVNEAKIRYRRSLAALEREMNDLSYVVSPFGRKLRELQELQRAFPQSSWLNMFDAGKFSLHNNRPVYRNFYYPRFTENPFDYR